MRDLHCGDRNWTDREPIRFFIQGKFDGFTADVIIHGAARGADSIAGEIAEKLGIEVEAYPAEWDEYGKAAGVIRNQQMLEVGMPDRVIFWHKNLEKSKGTRDMVRIAKEAGVTVIDGWKYWLKQL